jgi:2-keto-4-pentenoate hydratase/2-oxohepta-3-ene-1,7-dioic acid hydratase in catechol pathway
MSRDLERPVWQGKRPWYEIWFAVVLDEGRRRALWIRHSTFVPTEGDGRATTWGAWFDADATPPSRAAKRIAPLDDASPGDGNALIRIGDSWLGRAGASGEVDELRWDARWSGGERVHELPAWIPAPTHARAIVHDGDAEASVQLGGAAYALRGRAIAMHLWGKRRLPTLHWIWAPWLGDASLEVNAISLRDSFSLGFASLRLARVTGNHGGEPRGTRWGTLPAWSPFTGTPATAAHPHGLLTATVAGTRRLVHAHAWAEPDELVGYAYRDTDGRDLMVAQSDIGSGHYEQFARRAPGLPWKLVEERRSAGGVALEIHQRLPLPQVGYVGWDEVATPPPRRQALVQRHDRVDWPEPGAIVALGLTYADHAKQTGATLDPAAPPIAFAKHARTFIAGDTRVLVPTSEQLAAALVELEPALAPELAARFPLLPAVMDYEGELAVVALGSIDDDALAAGEPQPLGLAAANDLTARICQAFGEGTPRPHDYWACAKSFPRFLPVAERVWAPVGGLAKLPILPITTHVNGEARQQSSTRDLRYELAAIVRAARAQLGRPLERGDVIVTGTPAGIGLRLSALQRRLARMVKDRVRKAELLVSTYATSTTLLRPGDVVEVDAGPAGSVRTRLVV